MKGPFQIMFGKLRRMDIDHLATNDLTYIFRLYYKQSPGFIKMYQDLFRYYPEEINQKELTYLEMQEMKQRILKKIYAK